MQIVPFQIPQQFIYLNSITMKMQHLVSTLVRFSTLSPYQLSTLSNENAQSLSAILGQVTGSLRPFRGDHLALIIHYFQVIIWNVIWQCSYHRDCQVKLKLSAWKHSHTASTAHIESWNCMSFHCNRAYQSVTSPALIKHSGSRCLQMEQRFLRR